MPSTNTSFTAQLSKPAVAAINHLLAQEAWARAALKRHAGKEAVIDLAAFALRMRVGGDGLLEASQAPSHADVTIHVQLADLPLILQNRERAFSYVKIEGDAEFANTISQLSGKLRWEAEFDLERWIGPLAAGRLVGGARSAFDLLKSTHRKATENLAEFLTEEQAVLVRPVLLDDYGSGVVRLRDDVERAAKRVARLEQLLEQPRPAAPALGNPNLDH